MKLQWAGFLLGASIGGVNAMGKYMEEAMRGERVSGFGKSDSHPSWEPDFKDESPPYRSHRITREDWIITCSSSASGHPCRKAIDGKNSTTWRSDPSDKGHEITIDLGAWYQVSSVVILPPIDTDTKGLITHHKIWVSQEPDSWPESPVAYGMWPNTNRQRMSAFEPSSTRYLKITIDADQENPWVGISELNIYGTLYTIRRNPALGVWGPTLDFPIVPVSAAQEGSGTLALWSSWADDQFHSTPGGKTVMTRWDPLTEKVTNRTVSETHHDMFCPGISYDGTGMMVVTGGNDASETSLFDSVTDKWIRASEMKLRRGYQASTTLSDGRVFVIGGSWAGGSNYDKDGEVYDPATRNWTMLPGAKVQPMLTRDREGAWRADNHGWLFGWKNLSIFQAGPSKNMNWYSAHVNGSVEPAGRRLEDQDSMSGNAIMFDAVKGKILTLGGSPNYDKSWATNAAHIITIGEPGEEPKVEPAGGGTMHRERVFHTTVVLPDGKVAIFGGQQYGVAFNEETVQFVPEIYDPVSNTFTELQQNNVVRVYHTVSILLPDGRVLNAGGGLCGNCTANHYDGQVFTPPYLLTESGEPRPRPEILSGLEDYAMVGSTLRFQTSDEIESASLIRLGTNTHTVNTDQRRIPLDLRVISFAKNIYKTTLPKDSGILIPGYWMLFVMDEAGVPSIAKIMMIGLDKKRTIQPAQDPLGLLEAQNNVESFMRIELLKRKWF
ncbi:CAZyme family AA5 [Penicillium mononematosum]|uniref:CAZyme family AA5 n=1 Tax=Penicillium mononematosum TaxID=268346 RepID=UPI0025493B06|nr:CAZyme family AA5 [Penicillium mononematosum]KAJ6191442.1 CAZyme family AA5 [Penicillium mononematosum]